MPRPQYRRSSHRRTVCVFIACISSCAALSGCLVGPNFKKPDPPTPPAWASALAPPTTAPSTLPSGTNVPTTQASAATSEQPPVELWWKTFDDPALESLIDRAVASNLDVRAATSRLRQARANRQLSGAAFYPTVDLNGSYTRSGSGNGGSRTTINTNGTVATRNVSSSQSLYRAGVDASWELDVFGGLRRSIEAADADIEASVEDRRDVLVTLTSEVALNYLDLRGFQRQLDIANRNLDSQRSSAEITRKRFRGGFVNALDLANAEAQVASTQSQIPSIEQSLRQTIYNIGLLLAREPAALVSELSAAAPIPGVPPRVPVGLPSDLLRRRPDIRRAEAQLHAATARLGVATADLYPHFTLSGSLSTQGGKPASLFDWANRIWSFGPGVSYPLFDAGRIRANIDIQNAAEEQAMIAYQQAVLTALRDVDVALVAYTQEQRRHAALTDAVTASRRAVDLSTRLYAQGQTDFLQVLTAQRALFGSEDSLAQSDRTIGTNLVALYKALGGGWEMDEPAQERSAKAN